MLNQQASEQELLEQLRLSDSQEERRRILEMILTPYLGRIARWALRRCGSQDEAAEVAQDALLAVCSRIDGFRGECQFSTWLYTIVRNSVWKRGSRSARDQEVPLEEAEEPRTAMLETEEAMDHRRRIDEFRRIIVEELTPLEARVFLLHFGDGIPLANLDRDLSLTNRSGARAYLTAAKRKLRRRMRLLSKRTDAPDRLGAHGLAGIRGGKG